MRFATKVASLGHRSARTGLPHATHLPRMTQPPPDDIVRRKDRLSGVILRRRVTWPEIAAVSAELGDPYPKKRFEKTANGREVSQPVLDAAWAALDVIEERIKTERAAAAGDRAAMDRLDAEAERHALA